MMVCPLWFYYSIQAVQPRGISVKRVYVSMEVSARTSGTPTPATVPTAVEAKTVNKVRVCLLVSSNCLSVGLAAKLRALSIFIVTVGVLHFI